MDIKKLALRAALQRLSDGEISPELVEICEENIRGLLNETDDIRYTERMRERSDWSEEALARTALENIGNFQVTSTGSKSKRRITFTDGVTLIFVFVRKPRSDDTVLGAYFERARGNREEEIRTNVDAVIASTLAKGCGRDISPEEVLLGHAEALNDYTLSRVERKERARGLFGILGLKKRSIIFARPN